MSKCEKPKLQRGNKGIPQMPLTTYRIINFGYAGLECMNHANKIGFFYDSSPHHLPYKLLNIRVALYP
jgi:hypothetical protein